jgi:hypothetical protein
MGREVEISYEGHGGTSLVRSSADSQTLNDEIIAQNLELTSLSQQNLELRSDNAHLVQRWLDKMNLTADEMNVEFEKENAEVQRKEGEGDFQKGGKEKEKR